jgi:hypothetical protein
VWLAVVAIVLWLVISSPEHAAQIAQNLLGFLRHCAESILNFISQVVS